MSPALTASVSLPATTLTGAQPAHVNPHWNNPHPEGWRELDDNRKFCFQANHNLFLEMHSNGTRGVNATTKFCVLTILIMNITRVSLNNDSSQQLVKQWSQNRNTAFGQEWHGPGSARHVILGNATGLFLCMNDQSVVYQTRNFNTNHCVFDHEYENYTDRYFRQLNDTMPRWYLGMNKDGTMRCGNVTGKHQRGANFIKIFVDGKNVSESPPFQPPKKECCTKKSCKKRRRNRNRRCYKNWCNKHRRKFFTLKLKELRRYYKRCIKKADKVRHCSRKGRKNINR